MIKVCTGFSPAGYEQYGKRFLETFHKHWPKEFDLAVYTEEPIKVPRGTCESLWQCDGVLDFINRHKNIPDRNGTRIHSKWKERHRRFDYNFRFDAVKFCRQCFIPYHASLDLKDDDILIWLDGDVISLSDVPEKFILRLLCEKEITFLGRVGYHSEIGFWAVRINKYTRQFLKMFSETWKTDKVFELEEWHSAFVFDWCRKKMNLNENNLTPEGRGDVWKQSPLRAYTDHLKGKRKALARAS